MSNHVEEKPCKGQHSLNPFIGMQTKHHVKATGPPPGVWVERCAHCKYFGYTETELNKHMTLKHSALEEAAATNKESSGEVLNQDTQLKDPEAVATNKESSGEVLNQDTQLKGPAAREATEQPPESSSDEELVPKRRFLKSRQSVRPDYKEDELVSSGDDEDDDEACNSDVASVSVIVADEVGENPCMSMRSAKIAQNQTKLRELGLISRQSKKSDRVSEEVIDLCSDEEYDEDDEALEEDELVSSGDDDDEARDSDVASVSVVVAQQPPPAPRKRKRSGNRCPWCGKPHGHAAWKDYHQIPVDLTDGVHKKLKNLLHANGNPSDYCTVLPEIVRLY